MNLSALLEESAAAYAERTAVVLGEQRLTYADLDARANQVANLLVRHGIRPGDKVALSCPNIPQFTSIYFGILKAGGAVVPLNVLLKAREVAYHLADSDAKAYFAFEGTPELPIGSEAYGGFLEADGCTDFFLITATPGGSPAEGEQRHFQTLVADQPSTFETIDRDDEDTAVILYTSGTTGHPKGAELRHRNMRDNALVGRKTFRADPARPDTYLCVLPLFHSFGQTVVQNTALAFGGTLVLQPRFDPKSALELLAKERITFFAGVPTMFWGLLGALAGAADTAGITESLRMAVSGGSALPTEVHKDFKERFGVTILEGYGLSETSPVAAFSVYGEEPRVGSIGVPIPGVSMKLIDDNWNEIPDDPGTIGEIAISGHNVMKGYYKRPDATAEAVRDGWFRTGDLARKDQDGFYYIVDRAKDMIIRGGYNVYPREIEEVLMTHPAVSLVAVVGVPHSSHGEEIKAFVVREPGAETTEDDLLAWGKEQFASYKYPRVVEFVGTLPMTSTGKILKRELV
ncbi:long-chain-fatty-acid--CoA ligase [Streptomyces spongiae]|uniref:Long-chain fatty acid--CoA ligase n=1 Tax=Streptomyces spongiae TaxID=565072 RepID=A0A5N8XBP2_9ACTN|nr:long-chain fatty acid--CoA ligase [Streptomyces spongiae]MPY56556.1 long-chain fatty acid--CoA ligase [Streptomyces spongiae]